MPVTDYKMSTAVFAPGHYKADKTLLGFVNFSARVMGPNDRTGKFTIYAKPLETGRWGIVSQTNLTQTSEDIIMGLHDLGAFDANPEGIDHPYVNKEYV